jgi:hypothetical protein
MTETLNPSAFSRWLDDFFSHFYRWHPVDATFIGIHDHDHLLPDLSEEGMAQTAAEIRDLLRRSRALPDEPLSASESIDRRLAESFLEIQHSEYEGPHFWRGNPALYTGEAVFGVLGLLLRPFAPLQERLAFAVQRLRAVPRLLSEGERAVGGGNAP